MMSLKLGGILLEAGLLTADQLDEALRAQVVSGGRLGTVLIELGFLDEETLARVLSERFGVPRAEPRLLATASPEVVALLPREVARECQAVPFLLAEGRLHVAMADPADGERIARVIVTTQHPVQPYFAPEFRLYEALERHYGIVQEARYSSLARRLGEAGTDGGGPDGGVTLEEAGLLISKARDREEIADGVLAFGRSAFRRIALFVTKGHYVKGWRGAGSDLTDDRVQRIEIPVRVPSLFETVRARRLPYRGPVPDEPFSLRVITLLGEETPPEILVVPVLMKDRLVSAIYADQGNGALPAGAGEALEALARRMVEAFERLIVEARRITIQ